MLVKLKRHSNAVGQVMSKNVYPFVQVFAALLLILQFFTISDAQDVEATISISTGKTVSADITGSFPPTGVRKDMRNFSLLDQYAGTIGLASRFSKIRLYDRSGTVLEYKAYSSSELVASGEIARFSYTVDLTPFQRPSAAAHISWAREAGGILMLDDLLPQRSGPTARVTFEIPTEWALTTTEASKAARTFDVQNIEKSVFYVGVDRREMPISIGDSSITLSISGEWHFSDDEAVKIASSIFSEYRRLFGNSPATNFSISISKFPVGVGPGNWEADTRGRSVTIISSDTPFKTQSKQRLHEQFRHEIFHLWMPNGVNLSGNYDWFYEGFALYQSLRTGVATNTIGFDNFLDTLSRAYSIDAGQGTRLSLIEASKNRFSGSNTQVYARGMLVAFLCDLALLNSSKGKRSVEDLIREVYQKHHNSEERIDGNEALLAAFGKYQELRPITDRYITSNEKLEWSPYLQTAGLGTDGTDPSSRLSVLKKLNSRQKDLLDKLGYNTWRKLSKNSK